MASKVTLLLFLAVFMLACVASQAKECQEDCANENYKPICARCNGKFQTFRNNCLLKLHNCKKNDCVVVSNTYCGV